ncbi:MAG TPA: sialate O-acetylesterase [Herpetosiphonaceae bacterium]|nr:sialate O-acetylesterase [Herpetosiphonaceae bacterium]
MTALRFGPIWTDHMVVQRDRPAPIWGYGPPGADLELSFAGRAAAGRVGPDGRWTIRVNPGPACAEPGSLLVSLAGGGAAIRLRDVLVGDVWLCAGQSNMELGLADALDGAQAVATADHPAIRLFPIEKTSAPAPVRRVGAAWRRCAPDTVAAGGWGGFSAVAYWFARRVNAATGIPIGLIQAAFGGSKIHPFIHPAFLDGDPALDELRSELADADRVWLETLALEGLEASDDPSAAELAMHPFAGYSEWDQLKPATVWNAMIHPLLPAALRGVLWYQGESDVADPAPYPAKMDALARGFRHAFADDDLPLYFAQVAPYRYGPDADLLEFWEAQYAAADAPGCGMVATVDLGDLNDIHPLDKRPVGERLAGLALARAYGLADIPSGGPRLGSVAFGPFGAVVGYEAFGELATLDGGAPLGFELAGADGVFHPAAAAIDGGAVVLRCAAVAEPRHIRHCWRVGRCPNLSDGSAIPALPFRR